MKWKLPKGWKGVLIDNVVYAVVWTGLTLLGITLFMKIMDWYWKRRTEREMNERTAFHKS